MKQRDGLFRLKQRDGLFRFIPLKHAFETEGRSFSFHSFETCVSETEGQKQRDGLFRFIPLKHAFQKQRDGLFRFIP